MDDDSFRRLLDRLGLSWKGYARVRKGVKKRIVRHMRELGLQSVEDYLQALTDPEMLKEVERLMGVSISHFFRDRYLWRSLEEKILPIIIAGHVEEIHAWSAGCALGQEAYSLAVVWEMLKKSRSTMPELRIWATDINPDYIDKARAGIYGRGSLRGLTDGIKAVYFPVCEERLSHRAAESLRKYIVWQVHDLIRERPPQERFQIIFLRNSIFTYYSEELKASAFLAVLNSLDEGGFFIIGNHEKLPSQTHTLTPFECSSYIFQKT